ncbi:hypothetical protein C8024_12685 [Sphingopyxis sp. BSNA05]|nr:flagellar protein FliS [Sphingopyxis sp. BSNA05]NRD90134.1 hypothetical protein [Sphingopyxis sp. BSNA05]
MTFPCRNHRTTRRRNFVKASQATKTGPHGRVAGLLEELGETLGLIIESARRGEDLHIFQYKASARDILVGLDRELNFELAGDLSQTLRVMYNEAAKRIQLDGMEAYVERIESAREMILEIEKAWTEIVSFN